MTRPRTAEPIGTPRFRFPDGELQRAVLLGAVTDRSVRVWARLPNGPAEARLLVEDQEVATARLEPQPVADHVCAAVLEASPPSPGKAFEVVVGEMRRSARFAPPEGQPTRFNFAFGSCHQPFTDPDEDGRVDKQPASAIYPPIQRLLAEREAAFALWLGDQVYSDAMSELSVRERLAANPSITDADLLETYRHLYRGYFNETGYRGVSELLPAYLMWDDHDIFDGCGSLLERTAFDERLYRAAEAAYREYQHLRNPAGALDDSPPYGYSFWYGNVGFHVPDLRSERDFERGQVLGEAGWARLDAFLSEAGERDARTIFIGLSVPLVHTSPLLMRALERVPAGFGLDVRDRWCVPAFAHQRTMLLERLFGWQAAVPRRQVIILSGDVHVGATFTLRPRRGRGRLLQWTSSALSTPTGPKHVLANRLVTSFVQVGEKELRVWSGGLAPHNNVGLVEVEPLDGGGHSVRLSIQQFDERRRGLVEKLTDFSQPRP